MPFHNELDSDNPDTQKELAALLVDTRENWQNVVNFNKKAFNASNRSKTRHSIRQAGQQLERDAGEVREKLPLQS